MTLIEVLVVTLVIAVLSAMGYLGVNDYLASAKATKIIMNLHTLKKALWSWYVDNRDKVQSNGRVKIGKSILPIQNWQIDGKNSLKLSVYLKRLGSSGINFYPTKSDDTVAGRTTTNLREGCYGICDGGTLKGDEKDSYRNNWYAGYRFKDDEDAVRKKILGRLESSGGLWMGTADAHETPNGDNAQAVWLKVR